MTESGPSKQRLYALAAAGFALQVASIFLIVARDVSVAVVAPLLVIGMFMTFAPAIAARKAAGK